MVGKALIDGTVARFTVLIGLLLVLIGCGGGGGGGNAVTSPPVTASISVAWPLLTKGVNAPTSGLSVKFVLHDPTGKQSDVVWTGNRSSNIAAHTETYASSVTLAPASYVLSGFFYAAASETGTTVATFGSGVSVTPQGAVANNRRFESEYDSVQWHDPLCSRCGDSNDSRWLGPDPTCCLGP